MKAIGWGEYFLSTKRHTYICAYRRMRGPLYVLFSPIISGKHTAWDAKNCQLIHRSNNTAFLALDESQSYFWAYYSYLEGTAKWDDFPMNGLCLMAPGMRPCLGMRIKAEIICLFLKCIRLCDSESGQSQLTNSWCRDSPLGLLMLNASYAASWMKRISEKDPCKYLRGGIRILRPGLGLKPLSHGEFSFCCEGHWKLHFAGEMLQKRRATSGWYNERCITMVMRWG